MRTSALILGTIFVALAPASAVYANDPPATAAPRPIAVGEPLPRFDRLVPGTSRYLRYTVRGEKRSVIDIWSRTISFEPDATGRPRLHITQIWEGLGQSERKLDSWFEMDSFRPISHRTSFVDAATTAIAGVQFTAGHVRGDPAVADNRLASIDIATPNGTFNFETDIELMTTLPWHEGYSAGIPFYHPGGAAPQNYALSLTGSDTVIFAGRPVECWVATLDYGRGAAARFWIAKDSQTVIKVEQRTPGQPTVSKILLVSE